MVKYKILGLLRLPPQGRFPQPAGSRASWLLFSGSLRKSTKLILWLEVTDFLWGPRTGRIFKLILDKLYKFNSWKITLRPSLHFQFCCSKHLSFSSPSFLSPDSSSLLTLLSLAIVSFLISCRISHLIEFSSPNYWRDSKHLSHKLKALFYCFSSSIFSLRHLNHSIHGEIWNWTLFPFDCRCTLLSPWKICLRAAIIRTSLRKFINSDLWLARAFFSLNL